MSETILDGTGQGYEARVDETNRLEVRAVAEDGSIESLALGDHYALTSTELTLTSATTSAVLWFKNDENFPVFIDRIIFNSIDSVGGTEDKFKFIMYKNPTGITGGAGTPVTQVNTNFSSSNVLAITSEKGAEGATIDGGDVIAGWQIENPTRMKVVAVRLWLGKGASIGMAITPPASNTSLPITVALNAHIIKHG